MCFIRHQSRNFEVNVFLHLVYNSLQIIYIKCIFYSTVLLYPQLLILIIILHVLLISASYYYYFLYHRHLSSYTHTLSSIEPTAQSPFMPAKPNIYKNNSQPCTGNHSPTHTAQPPSSPQRNAITQQSIEK